MNLAEPRADEWRPRFHFTAPVGWINDPNGLVRVGETWHLQYQYEWPRCWGHATSRDLFRWEHGPVALQPDEQGDCWSGGTVHDRKNTSGLFAGAEGGLVSIYTSQDAAEGQRISLATSADGGRTWRKFPGNPILRRTQRECRDPKVFWDEARGQWAMVLTESVHLTFFVSSNLREWRETGRFTPRPEPGIDGVECPDLFALPVANRPGTEKWILVMSYLSGVNFAGNFGFGACAQRYYVGEFDGLAFTAEVGADALVPFGHGPDEYAAIVWPREEGGARRTVAIGWMNHWGYAKQVPTAPWQGCLTLPRELTLHAGANDGWEVRQAPARELWGLLHRVGDFSGLRLGCRDDARELGRAQSGAIRATMTLEENSVMEFDVLATEKHRTVVGYDAVRQVIYFDRREAGSPEFHPRFAARHEAPLPLAADRRLELILVFDRSTVEVFGGEGAVYLSGLTFPPTDADEIRLRVRQGAVVIGRLEVLTRAEG